MTTYKVPDPTPGRGIKPDLRGTYVARSRATRTRIIGAPGDTACESAVEDPVSGWLVIVEGPGRGEFLTLHYGVHTVGRNADNRLVLDFGEDAVSGSDHFRLIYEPRSVAFYVVHGTGKNLIDVDGQTLLDRAPLKAGSILSVGSTRLRFAPFCSAEFHWADEPA